jgi:hypothetical protein
VIRRVTTRPQPRNRCGYGAALPLHDGWVPSRRVRPQRFQAAAPGLVDSCAAHYPQRRHDVLAYFDHNASNGRPHRSHQRPATQILCYGHELSVLPARYLDDVAVELNTDPAKSWGSKLRSKLSKNCSQTRPNRSLLHLPRETAHDYPNLGCLSPASMSMSSMSDW